MILFEDLRFALRTLRKSPGFVTIVLLLLCRSALPAGSAYSSRACHPNTWSGIGLAFVLRPEGSLATLTSADQPETVQGSKVPGNLFTLLGAQPLLGRTFTQSEADRGEQTVVLSYELWLRRFGGARCTRESDRDRWRARRPLSG